MCLRKLFVLLCSLPFCIAASCESDIVHAGDPLYILIPAEDTLYFENIYAAGKPDLYKGISYVYHDNLYENGGIALPLSPFHDTLTYIFRQALRQDTLTITYTHAIEYQRERNETLYVYRDHRILYTTFGQVEICQDCYLLDPY